MPGKRIDGNTKEKVIDAFSEGYTRKEISEKYGISPRSITRIVAGKTSRGDQKKAAGSNDNDARQKRVEDIERRLELLEKRRLDLVAKRRY